MLQIPPSPLFFPLKHQYVLGSWNAFAQVRGGLDFTIPPGKDGIYQKKTLLSLPLVPPQKKKLPTYNPLQTSNLLCSIPFLNHVDLFLRNHSDLGFQKDPSIPAA